MEKIIYETCKIFRYFARYMSFKDWMTHYIIRLRLMSFQILGIFSILQNIVNTSSKGILVDKMGYGKIRYQIF